MLIMKKNKIISLFLIVLMLFGVVFTVAADIYKALENVVDMMSDFTTQDRKNMFTLIKPMIVSDSGIDVIESLIITHNPESDSLIDKMTGILLRHIDKDTAIKLVRSIKLIDEDIRRKYADAFDKREELSLSAEAMQAVEYFMNKVFQKISGLEQLMLEDKITAQVVANLLKAFVDINEGKPFLTDKYLKSDDFGVNTISSQLKHRADTILSENGLSGDSLIKEYISKINTLFSADEKNKIKKIGTEIGFYTPFREVIPSSSLSGEAYRGNEVSIMYSVITDKTTVPFVDTDGATIIEIACYINNVKQEFGELESLYMIKIPTTGENVMPYKIESSLIPVKYSVCVDNVLYMLINSTGYYGIMHTAKNFSDSDGWGSVYIENLYNRGIINGKAEGIFAPEDSITREEFVKLITELFDFSDERYYVNFSDVNREEWYYKYVAVAYKHGIINGVGNNRFGVGENITRQDICKIIHRVIELKNLSLNPEKSNAVFHDAALIADYAEESVDLMYRLGIVSGDGNGYFRPENNATRQEAAKIIHGILELVLFGGNRK